MPTALGSLDWPDLKNARDLGGLPLTGGRTTRHGALVRCDSPTALTVTGIERVRAYGVRRVIDLRLPREVEEQPSPFAGDAIYEHRSLIDIEAEIAAGYDYRTEPTPAEVYQGSLVRNAVRIVSIVGAIADAPDGAVLVHCEAGKDRAGIVVALVLQAMGVPDDEIVADYAVSDTNLRARLEVFLAEARDEEDRGHIRLWRGCVPETMEAFLAHVHEVYGGAEPYLLGQGLPKGQLDRLRERLVG